MIAPHLFPWLPIPMAFKKTYVDVIANIDEDGTIRPLSIAWRDGRTFVIDEVNEVARRASERVGGAGIRYLVSINGRQKFLYFEKPRWFVEEVVPD